MSTPHFTIVTLHPPGETGLGTSVALGVVGMRTLKGARQEAVMETQSQLTLLDLIEAVAEVTDSEAEQVSVVAHLVNSGRVRLTGNFRGSQLR
jgi:hypothetical protein